MWIVSWGSVIFKTFACRRYPYVVRYHWGQAQPVKVTKDRRTLLLLLLLLWVLVLFSILTANAYNLAIVSFRLLLSEIEKAFFFMAGYSWTVYCIIFLYHSVKCLAVVIISKWSSKSITTDLCYVCLLLHLGNSYTLRAFFSPTRGFISHQDQVF